MHILGIFCLCEEIYFCTTLAGIAGTVLGSLSLLLYTYTILRIFSLICEANCICTYFEQACTVLLLVSLSYSFYKIWIDYDDIVYYGHHIAWTIIIKYDEARKINKFEIKKINKNL